MPADIAAAAWEAFRADADAEPSVTLRAGVALDQYRNPPPFDPLEDRASDEYLERYAFDAQPFLDPPSWRHYLPYLIDYTIRHLEDSRTMVIEALLWSLRPPDRTPPRLGSLTPTQEEVIVALLERLVFGDEPLAERDFASQVMEEWWIPGSLYRPSGADAVR